jgi:hypothetical protein
MGNALIPKVGPSFSLPSGCFCELIHGVTNIATKMKSRCRWNPAWVLHPLNSGEEREGVAEKSRQAAAVLPSLETMEGIMHYESKLERQLFRAMSHLERLQRMRQGESVPPPMAVDLPERP